MNTLTIEDMTQKKAQTEKPHYSVISFFSGCGGMDLGFIGDFDYKSTHYPALPFSIEKAYDNNDLCVETYTKNIGAHISEENLGKFPVEQYPACDVLIGGFPCQDFSSCGPKRGLTSTRGKLFRVLVNYMKHHRPKIVVGENVPHLEKMRGGAILKTIRKELSEAGYTVNVWNLFAPEYGVPQRRRRLFIVAVRNDIPGFPEMPKATNSATSLPSIDWAIDDLIPVSDNSVPNQDQYFKASKAKRGNGQGDEKNVSGKPAYTVRANAKSRVQFHHKLSRRLTVRECARLQTFPDTFVFPHSATSNIMQVGNAVPPILAYRVAKSISDFLKSVK